MDSTDFLWSSIIPGIASLGISTISTTFWGKSAVGADHAGFLGSSAVPGDASLGVSTVSATFPRRNAIRVDSTDFLGSSAVAGIASMRVSIVSTTFLGRSAVGVDCTGFLGSSAVPEIASLGISPVSANFPGRSVVRGATLASWEAMLSWGGSAWESALLALSFWERVILGQTVLASWEAALSCRMGVTAWEVALVAWEASTVIFPSFLHTKLLNLFTCLLFTLLNLSSLTFSVNPWHFLNLEVDQIDANFDLHSSLCLALLSRLLLMDLILACSNCSSAVLIIFLAFSVLKVVFNLYSLVLTLYGCI